MAFLFIVFNYYSEVAYESLNTFQKNFEYSKGIFRFKKHLFLESISIVRHRFQKTFTEKTTFLKALGLNMVIFRCLY